MEEVQKNIRQEIFMLRPKKNSYKELITKKYSCGSKIPFPSPITFLMVRPFGNSYYLLSFTTLREHPVFLALDCGSQANYLPFSVQCLCES